MKKEILWSKSAWSKAYFGWRTTESHDKSTFFKIALNGCQESKSLQFIEWECHGNKVVWNYANYHCGYAVVYNANSHCFGHNITHQSFNSSKDATRSVWCIDLAPKKFSPPDIRPETVAEAPGCAAVTTVTTVTDRY